MSIDRRRSARGSRAPRRRRGPDSPSRTLRCGSHWRARRRPLVEAGLGRRADHARALGIGPAAALEREARERVPAGRALPVETDRLGEIVDGGLGLVDDVHVFRDPEEARRHQPRERGAVLFLGDVGELLAEGLVGRIVHHRRQRDGDRLVRLRRHRLALAAPAPTTAPARRRSPRRLRQKWQRSGVDGRMAEAPEFKSAMLAQQLTSALRRRRARAASMFGRAALLQHAAGRKARFARRAAGGLGRDRRRDSPAGRNEIAGR